jgi:hypothetical protein
MKTTAQIAPATAADDYSPWRFSVAPMMDWTDRVSVINKIN